MSRSAAVRLVTARFPGLATWLLVRRLKDQVPSRIAGHWLWEVLAKELASHERKWVSYRSRLCNGMTIEVDPRDWVGEQIIKLGCFEADTVSAIASHLQPGMVFLDVGAHVGQYSLLASGLVGPRGAVHAFEPNPLLHAALERNVARNRCRNVTVSNLGVDDRVGEASLFLSGGAGASTSSMIANEQHYSGRRATIQTVTLDEYARRAQLTTVDLVKIDVEGAELRALRGGHELFARSRRLVLVVEFAETHAQRFGYSTDEVAGYLRQLGFNLFRISPTGLEPYVARYAAEEFFNVLAKRDG